VVPAAAEALRPGGILLAYLPTINQTALLRQVLDDPATPFGLAETQEIMRRTWHVEARSVRPDHRMVGHTGFLTAARRLAGVTGGVQREGAIRTEVSDAGGISEAERRSGGLEP